MRRLPLALLSVSALAALVVVGPPAPAAQPKLTFGKNVFPYDADYGEPALDIGKDGTLYVSTPGDGGAVLARSDTKGLTWKKLPTARTTAPQAAVIQGGDSDVAVADDGTVYAADLNGNGITIFRSEDKGETFDHQVFVNASADREWIATDGEHGEDVYLVWHELATGTMLAAVSHDRAETFGVPTILYSQPTTIVESVHNGTSLGEVVTDGSESVYVVYGTSRITGTPPGVQVIPISAIKVSISHDKGDTWQDVTVNAGADDADYGNFWMATGIDTAGFVYAVYSGRAHAGEPMHVWLQQSQDEGLTWSEPFAVDVPALAGRPDGNDLFGWVAGGGKGVAVVSWYHTDAPDKDADGIDWVVPVAQVRGLDTDSPQVVAGIASDHVMHKGGICTLGILCGIAPGSSDDRSLLDFFEVGVDNDGMPVVAWSDNNRVDGDTVTGVGFARQSGGPSALAETLTAVVGKPPVRPVAKPPVAAPPAPAPLPATGSGPWLPALALGTLVAAGVAQRRSRLRRS